MIWWLAAPLVLALWWLWDIRRVLKLRILPRNRVVIQGPAGAQIRAPAEFLGAVAPNRFIVVRWPIGMLHYQGCLGAHARQSYEHEHPLPGEAVELWEQATCRGHKEG